MFYIFVPSLNRNLLSAGKIENTGLNILLNDGKVIMNQDTLIAIEEKKGNLYKVIFDIICIYTPKISTNLCKNNYIDYILWHRRFEHVSQRNLNKRPDVFLGLNLDKSNKLNNLNMYVLAK